MSDSRPLRKIISEVLSEVSQFSDSKSVAKLAVERMTDAEKYEALLSFLPRMVRQLHNERLVDQGEDLPSFDQRVVVRRDEMRLGEVDAPGFDALSRHREATAKGFAQRAEQFRTFQDALTKSGAGVLDELTQTAIAELVVDLRHRLRRREILNRNVLRLEQQLEQIEREGVSPRVVFLERELEAERKRLDAEKQRQGFLRRLVSKWTDPTVTHSAITHSRPLKKAREFLGV